MAFYPAQLQPYALSGGGAVAGATSLTLKSFQTIDGVNLAMTDFGSKGFATLEPGNGTQEEQISFTGVVQNSNGTATLSGVKTVLFLTPYTEASGLAKTHAGSTSLVISNTAGFYNEFPAKENDEIITGQWTFTNTPIVPGTVSNASTTVKGVSKLSVAALSATDPIVVGDNDTRVVPYAVSAAGTDAYAITTTPVLTSYTAGQKYTFLVDVANTGAATLNVNALGAKTIKKVGSLDLADGDLAANEIALVEYDGTNFQLLTPNRAIPTTKIFLSKVFGSSTTQFDITNPSGTTFRYTFDGTGTDPVISQTSVPVNSVLTINGQNFTAGNNGTFTVTAVGTNFFEVSNASGVVESNKTLGTGSIVYSTTWTKPTGLRYVDIDIAGGGGASNGNAGAGAGGYSHKRILVATLGATETVTVGAGATSNATGGNTSFGAHATANGGVGTNGTTGGAGGTAASGDINIPGGKGQDGAATPVIGNGGVSHFGGNPAFGAGSTGAAQLGITGIVMVTEYY